MFFVRALVLSCLWISPLFALIDCRTYLLNSGRPELRWESRFLTGNVLDNLDKASDVLQLVATNEAVRAEIHKFLEQYGGLANLRLNPQLWRIYLNLYDAFIPFSKGYRELVNFNDRFLPKHGRILDAGSGTGNMGASLMLGAPTRQVEFMDMSRIAMEFAQANAGRVASYLGGSPLDFIFSIENVMSYINFPSPGLAGAVANLALYNIPHVNHLQIVKWIHTQLADGGIFALADPDPAVIHDQEDLEDSAQKVIFSAIDEGAIATDFEAALLFYINTYQVAGHFRSSEDWKDLVCRQAGFELVESDHGLYYGIVNAYIFRK